MIGAASFFDGVFHKRCSTLGVAVALCLGLAGCTGGDSVDGGGAKPAEAEAIWGAPGMTPGEFTIPRAVAIGTLKGREKVWIVDKSGRMQRFDSRSGTCEAWWKVPNCEAGKPTGLTIGPAPAGLEVPAGEDVLYVAHTHDHKVLIYGLDDTAGAPSGPKTPGSEYITPSLLESHPKVIGSWGSFGTGDGQFIYPTDVAILTAADGKTVERFYVSEYGDNDRISVFDPSMRFLFRIGTYGASAAPDNVQFDRPQSMEIDAKRRELVVADARNHRIGRFTLDGQLLAWIGSPDTSGGGAEQWRYPWGLTLMGDGTALVVEFGNNRLHRVDLLTGATLGTIGRPGREKGEFAQPWALAVSGDRTFVVDTGNHRVQVIRTGLVKQ